MTQVMENYKTFCQPRLQGLLLDDFQSSCSSGKLLLPAILKVEKALASTSHYIAMQIRKINCEKGYYRSQFIRAEKRTAQLPAHP